MPAAKDEKVTHEIYILISHILIYFRVSVKAYFFLIMSQLCFAHPYARLRSSYEKKLLLFFIPNIYNALYSYEKLFIHSP